MPAGDVFRHPVTGALWRRQGACNRCGSCCAGCTHLSFQADGLATCSGRDSAYYANGCIAWPTLPAQAAEHPRCSYAFERVS